MSDDQSLDDALASIGVDTAPISREDELYLVLTEGNSPRIHGTRYWLRHEMFRFEDMKKQNIKITIDKVLSGQLRAVPMSNLEYARIALKYYLQMQHMSYFMPMDNKPPADMNHMIDMLTKHHLIASVIDPPKES